VILECNGQRISLIVMIIIKKMVLKNNTVKSNYKIKLCTAWSTYICTAWSTYVQQYDNNTVMFIS